MFVDVQLGDGVILAEMIDEKETWRWSDVWKRLTIKVTTHSGILSG